MGKLVVTEFITLDGVIEAPGGGEGFAHAGWSFKFNRGDEGDKFKFDELLAADVQLLGRVTYQGFAQAWPSMAGNPFGDKMNAMPKYVVSSTLTADRATWNNSTVIGDDVAGQVARLKEEVARDILVAGSAQLVRSLAAADLVDEYRLMLFPVVLAQDPLGVSSARVADPSSCLLRMTVRVQPRVVAGAYLATNRLSSRRVVARSASSIKSQRVPPP